MWTFLLSMHLYYIQQTVGWFVYISQLSTCCKKARSHVWQLQLEPRLRHIFQRGCILVQEIMNYTGISHLS